MVSPLPLSVVIVARNEARNLPRCLASVQNLGAELAPLGEFSFLRAQKPGNTIQSDAPESS